MFDLDGTLNAVFVPSADVQQSFFGHRNWDKVPLTSRLFCLNSCSSDCNSDLDEWFLSTQHLYFKDHTQIQCPADADCGWTGLACCESDAQARKDNKQQISSSGATTLVVSAMTIILSITAFL